MKNHHQESMKPKIEDEAPVEKALASFIKSFKGNCHNCGKYGHKGADCPERKISHIWNLSYSVENAGSVNRKGIRFTIARTWRQSNLNTVKS